MAVNITEDSPPPLDNAKVTYQGNETTLAAALDAAGQSGGGGGGNAFGTIVVAGSSNIVADSATDTLTVVAGTGIAIVTDPQTSELSISTQVGGGNMSTSVYDTVPVSEQLVGITASQTVENKRLKDVSYTVQAISNPAAIDLNNGNVLTYTMTGNTTFNITAGVQVAGNAQIAEFWLTGNYTPTFQVGGNAVTFVNGPIVAQTGGATYIYAIKLNGSTHVVGFNPISVPTGAIVGTTDTQTLTNKTIDDNTNTVRANKLRESGGTVLTMGAVSDGQALVRSGSNIIGGSSGSSGGGIVWSNIGTTSGPTPLNAASANGFFGALGGDHTLTVSNWPAGEDKIYIKLTGTGHTPTFAVQGTTISWPGGTPGAQTATPTIYVLISEDNGTTVTGAIGAGAATAGSGDVTAASAFANDNRLIRSDGAVKGVQASGITIDDSNNVSGVGTLNGATLPTTGTIVTRTATETLTSKTIDDDTNTVRANKIRESGGTVLTMGAVSDGQALVRSGSNIVGGTAGGSGYGTIQEEGSSLTQRATLNFVGAGVTAADNAGQTCTDVTIKGTKAYVEDTDVQNGETYTTTSDAYNEITLTGTTASRTITVTVPATNGTMETTTLKCINSGATTKTRSFGVSSGTLQWVGGSAPAEMTTDAAWQLITFVSRKNSGGTAVTIGTLIGSSS